MTFEPTLERERHGTTSTDPTCLLPFRYNNNDILLSLRLYCVMFATAKSLIFVFVDDDDSFAFLRFAVYKSYAVSRWSSRVPPKSYFSLVFRPVDCTVSWWPISKKRFLIYTATNRIRVPGDYGRHVRGIRTNPSESTHANTINVTRIADF